MSRSLVIVESPAKAKTINKYLGKNFIVKSSVGHIRDLPTGATATKTKKTTEKGKKEKLSKDAALVRRMGIDPYHDWNAHYEILPGKENVVSELKTLAKNADIIYLATDMDREGEAIAWHLQEIIGGNESRFRRVVFNEITKNAIQQAFESPSSLNLDRVNAQQARRFMDRVVGFMVSPLLWKKVARGLSAGRVQSVAVRLIVEKEKEIKAFLPVEYWQILAHLSHKKTPIEMEVTHFKNKPIKLPNKKETDEKVELLKKETFIVESKETKRLLNRPSAPFITSTLQQAASTRLGFGVKRTMLLAQKLYEAGFITYMRTDSTNLSQDAIRMARDFVQTEFGNKYLPQKPNFYSNKENSQEAHEAIRPSNAEMKAEMLPGTIDTDAKKLYQLIWSQFLACQMVPAEYDSMTLTVKAGDFLLKAKGRVLIFDGWTKVQFASKKSDEDNLLPDLPENATLDLKELIPSQHFTKPPARFSEASLVKELEKRGIGRPSTYASIISTIQERGYVRVENRRFYAEKMGEIVTQRLQDSFQDLMNYDFTAKMENQLDAIAEQKLNWKKMLDAFFGDFSKALEKAELAPEEGGMKQNRMVLTEIKCNLCARKMGVRTASTGVFLGCSGYELPPKERCKGTLNLIPEHEIIDVLDGDEAETFALKAKRRCEKCQTAMDSYLIDSNRKIYICGNNPICDGIEIENGAFKLKGYDGPIVECDRCGNEMHLKMGRFGKYMACTNAECKNTRKILKNGEVAPPKEDPIHIPELPCQKSDAYFVLRDGASGIFLAAHNFPKSRETRSPYIDELIRFKDRLPEKFLYLTKAPIKDPEGNRTLTRFSRKNKIQYVSSEKDEKPTKWAVFYDNGKWIEKNAK